MRNYHYRTFKNIFMGLLSALLALGCALSWFGDGGFFSGAGALLFALGTPLFLHAAMKDEPALSFDATSLTVRSIFKTARVDWKDVLDISVHVVRLRYWGIIPISKQENLSIKYDDGSGGTKKAGLSLGMVKLPPGGAQLLLAQLNTTWVAAVGEARVAMAGAGKQGWGAERRAAKVVAAEAEATDTGFDHDAAIQRYLAAKAAAAPVAPDAPAVPSRPARPTFGRRVA